MIAALAVGGCAPAAKAPEAPQKRPSLAMDPCAERLHEVAGLLLRYYAAERRLPASMEELKGVDPGVAMVCPTTGQPYVFDAKGLSVAEGAEVYGRMVVYDSVAGHRGMRWGVAVVERPGRPPETRVIAAPGTAGTAGTGAKPEVAPWR